MLAQAETSISKLIGQIVLHSSIYETEAWGKTDQPNFLNQVLICDTHFGQEAVLDEILTIEESMGRSRDKKWEARKIDIDILFFNEEIFEHDNLKIPHPHLHERKFTLVPLAEVMPDYIHPVLKKTVRKLLSSVNDPLEVKKLSTVTA